MSIKASKRAAVDGGRVAPPTKKSKATASKPATRRSSESSGTSASDEDARDDKAAMLAVLQAHSRALFGMQEPVNGESSKAGRKRLATGSITSDEEDEEEGEVEDGVEHSDDGWGAGDGFVSDSEDEGIDLDEAGLSSLSRSVPEVVFAPSASSSRVEVSKSDRRAFLKSTSTRMMGVIPETSSSTSRKRAAEDDVEDQTHRKLDKSLHEMLLSNLLPSAAVDAASRPVEKRNAMYGRLRELANLSESGKGSEDIRGAERRHHPAKIRTILMKAKEGRDVEAKREDIEAGNFVRGLGGLMDGNKKGKGRKESRMSLGTELRKKGMDGRKKGDAGRDRGLTMGVGKFKGGMLSLSERDIARVSGQGRHGGGKKKGGKGKRR